MWQFQLPPPLDDRFRTFLGVFFLIGSEGFYYFIHTLVGFAGFVFWGFHFHALHEFPIFKTLCLFSLSFSPGSFSSIHNVFPPQKPQKPDASVEESTTVLKRVFVVSANFMLKSFFTYFIQTQNAPLEIRRRSQTNFTRDIYHHVIKEYIFLVIPDVEIASRVKQEKVGPTFNPCPNLVTPLSSVAKDLKKRLQCLNIYPVHINAWVRNWPF